MKLWIIISALTLLLAANTANAWTKEGRSLVHGMEAYYAPNGDLTFSAGDFVGYVGGVFDATIGVHSCAPIEVKMETLLTIVRKYIKKHPELLDVSAYALVVNALNEAFPCEN